MFNKKNTFIIQSKIILRLKLEIAQEKGFPLFIVEIYPTSTCSHILRYIQSQTFCFSFDLPFFSFSNFIINYVNNN